MTAPYVSPQRWAELTAHCAELDRLDRLAFRRYQPERPFGDATMGADNEVVPASLRTTGDPADPSIPGADNVNASDADDPAHAHRPGVR